MFKATLPFAERKAHLLGEIRLTSKFVDQAAMGIFNQQRVVFMLAVNINQQLTQQALAAGVETDEIASMAKARRNKTYLPNAPFPDRLEVTTDLHAALAGAAVLEPAK